MRRTFLHGLAGAAALALAPLSIALAKSDSAPLSPAVPDALSRPALESAKASGAAMLAIARAGQRLVAVGERGIVLLSEDEGKTWRQAAVPVSVTLTALHFANEKLGWAVGHLGVILHTSDGGEHWSVQLDGIKAAQIAVDALSEAERNDKSSAWVHALVDDGPDKPFLDVFFLNDRIGYAVGAYNLAFRTEDGGNSWQSWITHLENPKGLHLYSIRAVGSALFIAGEQGLLLRSTDLGQRFHAVASPSKGTFFGIVVGLQEELLLYGLRGRAFLTIDGGVSWSEIDTGTRASISAGVRFADGTVLLASQAGELLLSRDGGRSFRAAPDGAGIPVSALLPTSDRHLAVATLRGMRTIPVPTAPGLRVS